VLLEVGRKGLEVLVVCLDVLHVCSVPAKYVSHWSLYEMNFMNGHTSPCIP
jgi:hypothetical protein